MFDDLSYSTFSNLFSYKLNYKDEIILLGSCFADNIYKRLKADHFNAFSNPFGITFNPVSINNHILRIVHQKYYQKNDFFYFDNYWWNFDHHGKCAQLNLDKYLVFSNSLIDNYLINFKTAKHLFVSFGTSTTFVKDDYVVNNCHKQPFNDFTIKTFKADSLYDLWFETINILHTINPKLNIYFTVSPVRYFKEGITQNAYSKAQLITFANDVANKFELVTYLPVYELIIDVWRDFTFFNPDGLHLNTNSLDKLYDYLLIFLLDDLTLKKQNKWRALKKLINHELIHPDSLTAIAFKNNLKHKLFSFSNEYGLKIDYNL